MYIHFSIFYLYLEARSLQAVKIIANSNYGWSRTRKEKLNHFKTHFIFTLYLYNYIIFQHETHITPIQTHQEVFSTQRTCNQHRQGRKRGKGAEKWRVMIYGDQRDAEPVSLISEFIVWRRKIFHTRKLSINTCTFSSLFHSSLLVKASHSSLEMLLCFQKSPSEYPDVVAVVMGISAPPVPWGLLWAGASGTGF